MKHCDDYELMIADVLAGRLDELSAAEFEAHLEICVACQASFERFERTALILNDAYPASSTENAKIWARVEESLSSKRAVAGRSSVATISPWAPLFGAAAMVALAVLLFLASPKARSTAEAHSTVPKDSKDNRDIKDNRRESASERTTVVPAIVEISPPKAESLKEPNPPPPVAATVIPTVPSSEHIADPQPAPTTRGPREIIDDSRGLALLRRTGAVAIFDANHQAWRPIVAGERVPYGTAVRTGAGALAELAFGESRVRLDEKTEVTIASAEARVAELSHGRLRVDLLRSERPFRIRSGGGTVELTGTVVDVDAPAPDLAFVRVLEGHVKVDQALSDSNSDRPALPVAIDHEALVAFRAPDSILEALPQPVRSRALNLAHDRGHAAFSDPNVKNWTDPLDHPPSKSDAAVGQLIVKDEQGHEAAPLSVARMDIEASVRGPESITKIDQSFLNTTDRTLEGTFYFPLPPGAAISRFAMYVDPKTLIEGEVVERGKARAIFNSILRQRRDPALLEWMEGNLFKARIFPIPPHSEKRVILEYTQLLPAFYDTRRYVFPLVSELTEKSPIGKLSVRVNLATGDGSRFEEVYSPSYSKQTQVQGLGCANAVATLNLSNIKPNADFVLTFSAPRPSELFSTAYAEKDEQPYALLGYEPRLARGEGSGVRGQGTANGRDILFLVETSGTRSTQDLDAQRRVLESMLSGLDPAADRVALAAADIGITQLSNGFQSIDAADVANAMQSLKQRVPLGGLDLGASLREASDLFGVSARKRMILFVGAGVPALGTLDSGKLAEEVSAQLAHARTSFTAVAIGRSVESLTLSELARRSGGFYVPLKVDEGLDEAAFQLGLSLQSPLIESPLLKSAGDTLSEIYPTQLGSLLPGQEVFVHARLPLASGPRDAVHLSVAATLNGAPFARSFDVSLPRHLDADPAVGRFWARARLDHLLTQPQTDAQRHEVINLAQTWTLMSPYTSFLVLESNDDYKRYDIDRSKRRPAWKDAPIEVEQPRIELAEKLSSDVKEMGRELATHTGGNWRHGFHLMRNSVKDYFEVYDPENGPVFATVTAQSQPFQDQIVISSGEFIVDLTGKLNGPRIDLGTQTGNIVDPFAAFTLQVPPAPATPGLDGIWGTPDDTPFIPGTPTTVAMQNRTVVAPHLHWKARKLDAAYENNLLILVGTKENPINIDQQTVVKGDIIIKGYYTGAGSLWAQGNVYLPSDMQYRSTSYSLKDSGKATGNVENLGGLVAGGTIVIGDYLVTSANRLKIDDAAMTPDFGLLVTGRTDSAEPLKTSVHRAYTAEAERNSILGKMDFTTPEPQDDVFKNVHYDLSLTPDTSPTGADYIENGVYNFASLFDNTAPTWSTQRGRYVPDAVATPTADDGKKESKNDETPPVLKRVEILANDSVVNSDEFRQKEEIQTQASAHLEAGGRLFNSFQYEEARKELELAVQLDRTNEKARAELIRINDILGVRRDRIKSAVAQLYGEHKVAIQEKLIELDNRLNLAKRDMTQAQSDPDLSTSERIRKYQQGRLALERAHELIKYLPVEVNVEEQNNEVNRLLTQTGKDIATAETRLQETDREEATRLSAEHAASEKRFFEQKVNKMTDEASTLFEVGQFDEAVSLAKKITEIDPTNPEAHSIIATARERAHVENRKFIDEEYKEQFELNREHADRLNIPHRDYLIYPDNWQEITQRTRMERDEVEVLKKDIEDLRKRLSATSAPTKSGFERTLDNRYGPNEPVPEKAGQNYYIKGHDAKIQYRAGENDGTALLALRTKNFLGTDYDATRHETFGRKEVAIAAKDDIIRQQETLIAQEKADNDKLHAENQQLGAENSILVERNANADGQSSASNIYDEQTISNLNSWVRDDPVVPLMQAELKMYDVRDLSKSIADFPGPRIEIGAANKLPEKTTPEVDYAQALNERIKKELPNSTSSVALQNGQLVVMATPSEQEKVQKLIEQQRAIAAMTAEINGLSKSLESPASWKTETLKKLQRKITFDFNENPLADAIDFINTLTKVNITIDPKVASTAAVKTPITLRVSDMEIELALRWVMKLADLDFDLREVHGTGCVFISTRDIIKDGAAEPPAEKSSSELMREKLLLLLTSTGLTPETRLQLHQKLASISSGVDAYRALSDGIADFKSEGPQAEALAHQLAQRIRVEQDAKVLDQILDTKATLVKQDKEQTHGPEAHATITDTGLRARMLSRRAELESDPAKRCEFCQRAYAESENDATYLHPLAESFLAGSQNQPAVKYIEESLRQGAAEAWMYPTLAKAYAALGDVKNSMRALTQDVALRPREGAPRIELARAFDALGRGPEAVRELRAACEFAFESAAAHRELLAMAKKYHDNDAREWVLLAMLGSMWLSQDGDVWGEARRDFDALNNELKDAGKFDHIKELATKRKIAEANDIVAVMKWDTNHTDIDLHVIEPGDQRVSYSSRTSFRGGMLDHDNTSGYGPETYTLKRGAPGHYLIKVHFYSGNVSTNVNVIVTRKQGTTEESVQTFDVKLKHSGDEAKIIEFDIAK